MSLQSLLETVLPSDELFEIYHIQSPPREVLGFVNKTQDRYKDANTVKVQHFLNIGHRGKIFFSIEINIYIICSTNNGFIERYLFVSKADTNGYNDIKIKIGDIVFKFLQFLLSIDLSYYLVKVIPQNRTYPDALKNNFINKKTTTSEACKILSRRAINPLLKGQLVKELTKNNLFCTLKTANGLVSKISSSNIVNKIALFTRPEPQYLFSESSKNPRKHILSGEQLLKWWLNIVNRLIFESFDGENQDLKATLQIPGEDDYIIRKRYIERLNITNNVWQVGSIYGSMESNVYNLPLFPDDPKTRFLKDILAEGRYDDLTLDQFWKELQARQEFRLGIVVGVIGVEGHCKESFYCPTQQEVHVPVSMSQFKAMKRYVVGEEYDTVEGAHDARDNLREYYISRLKKSPFCLAGKMTAAAAVPDKSNLDTTNKPAINDINTLVVRKQKK